MSYLQGPYQFRAFLPPPDRPTAGTSRFIDGKTKRFELTPEGGFVTMPDTMQRVLLLLSFRVPPFGPFSTDVARATWRDQAFKALRVLTDANPPDITGLTITMSKERAGADNAVVEFIDSASGRKLGARVGATGTEVVL